MTKLQSTKRINKFKMSVYSTKIPQLRKIGLRRLSEMTDGHQATFGTDLWPAHINKATI